MTTAKVLRSGRSQAVWLPKEFRFDTDEVCIPRIGPMVILFDPKDRREMLLGALGQATEDFLADRSQPAAPERRKPL